MTVTNTSRGGRVPWRWPRTAREARVHTILVAGVLWIAAVVTFAAGPSARSIAGPLKGADFVHFYTIGWLARTHHAESLYDFAAVHNAQVALVPESTPELYVPVYPPQTALLFAPVTWLSFNSALLVWTALTMLLFALVVRSARVAVADHLPDRVFVFAAAAAFPPFWSLVLHGQTSIVVLVAFWLGWRALERQRPFLAGVAFGLLAIKPQFAIPLVAVVLATREWRMAVGAAVSIAGQAFAIAALLGAQTLSAFAGFLPSILRNAELLDPKPFQSHSLHTLTRLLPSWIGQPVWLVLAGVIVFNAIRVWTSHAPLRVRMGFLVLASVLVNPHLNAYDATVLALPLLWFGAYVNERGQPGEMSLYWRTTYWTCVALLAPSAALIGVQVSVFLMLWLAVQMARIARSDAPPGVAQDLSPVESQPVRPQFAGRMPSPASFSATSLPTS